MSSKKIAGDEHAAPASILAVARKQLLLVEHPTAVAAVTLRCALTGIYFWPEKRKNLHLLIAPVVVQCGIIVCFCLIRGLMEY